MKKRADQLLVEKAFASSRTLAQEMIKNGEVLLKSSHERVRKPGQLLEDEADFEIHDAETTKYVSRAGFKLEHALERVALPVKDAHVLDVGLSTGGFTDCMLQNGASRVIGVDVGHGQTHAKLIQNFRVKIFEGINARELGQHPEVVGDFPKSGFEWIVMDVSFISMTLIVPEVLPYLKEGGNFLGLVKPQFEVGREGLGKGGLVKDPELYLGVEKKIRDQMQTLNMKVMDYFPSELEGKDGNKEFFVWAVRA